MLSLSKYQENLSNDYLPAVRQGFSDPEAVLSYVLSEVEGSSKKPPQIAQMNTGKNLTTKNTKQQRHESLKELDLPASPSQGESVL